MRRNIRATLFVSLIIILCLLAVKCAVNPVTGKKEIMLISQNQEIQMGREIDQGIRIQYGLYPDPDLTAYVNRIGHKLVPFSHRPNLDYHFAVLDTEIENAFAAPGGFIYITRGLLALVNSEAELATVIGHELGHVAARHSARQMTRSILFTIGIALASELSEDFHKIAPFSWIATQLLFLKYSRSDEYQADALGLEYAIKAGYNSRRMINFFNSLQNLTLDEGGPHLPNFLSTHPLTPKRINHVSELLDTGELAQMASTPNLKVNEITYLNKINGIVYGQNPRQGYVENNVFYHPDMGFSFRVPYGWQVQNTARQVTLTQENGKAVIILQAEDTTENLEKYTTNMINNLTSPQIFDQGFYSINGLNSYRTQLNTITSEEETDEGTEKTSVDVDISCIRKGKTIFTFYSVAEPRDYRDYEDEIARTVRSFGTLKSSRHMARKPLRLYITTVDRPQTLDTYLIKQKIPVELRRKIALLNSMTLSQRLTRNQKIKIVK